MMDIFIVKRGAPAFELIKREMLGKAKLRPGQVLLASEEELESWRADVEIVTLNRISDPDPEVD